MDNNEKIIHHRINGWGRYTKHTQLLLLINLLAITWRILVLAHKKDAPSTDHTPFSASFTKFNIFYVQHLWLLSSYLFEFSSSSSLVKFNKYLDLKFTQLIFFVLFYWHASSLMEIKKKIYAHATSQCC